MQAPDRTCAMCSKPFATKQKHQFCCSRACSKERWRVAHAARRASEPKAQRNCLRCRGHLRRCRTITASSREPLRYRSAPTSASRSKTSCPGDYVVQHRKQRRWPTNTNLGCTIRAVANVLRTDRAVRSQFVVNNVYSRQKVANISSGFELCAPSEG